MKNLKLTLLALTAVFALTFFGCKKQAVDPTVTSDAKGGQPVGTYSVPTLSCAGSTLESIDITVSVSGPNYAPAGFSIQWMTLADYTANGWPLDSDNPPVGSTFCKASFSGKAYLSNYSLTASHTSVTVRIGDLLLDNGASTNCPGDLICGTDYVFRAFSHGDNVKNKSAFSANQPCSTLACPATGCVHGGLGYWKNNDIANWPVAGLYLGTNWYTDAELLSILNYSDAGNGLVIIAHQLIPARLNQASGADYSGNAAGLAAADTYIGSYVIPPVGSGYKTASSSAGLVSGINAGNHSCP